MSDTSQPTVPTPTPDPTQTTSGSMASGDPGTQPTRAPDGTLTEPGQTPNQATTPPTDGEPSEPTSTSKTDPAAKPTSGAPEAYADFRAPEGYTLEPKVIEAAAPIFKELGLTQDQAQRLVDFHSQQMIDAAKAPADAYANTRKEWVAAVEADPEIKAAVADGKTGIEAVKVGISKTLAALGDPALTANFKAAMDLTGAGDNPAFIKAMWKLSAFITEGKHVTGQNPSPHGQVAPGANSKPSAAQALYPNLR